MRTFQRRNYLTVKQDYIYNMTTIVQLEIRRENLEAHLDIDREMVNHKEGWYHFELRFASGKIMDFVTREFIDYGKPKQK